MVDAAGETSAAGAGGVIALVHSAPSTLQTYRRPNLGVLSSPRRFYLDVDGWTWAADNDAFGAWDEDRFRVMLDALATVPGCRFVTAPDVVGDHEATLERFFAWEDELAATRLPVAFVLQDGCDGGDVPWDRIAAVFVGGTDLFKMGEPARALVDEAKRLGKWVHMGRVNGRRRIKYALAIGCDSFDGTSMSWFKDRWLVDYLDTAAQPQQLILR